MLRVLCLPCGPRNPVPLTKWALEGPFFFSHRICKTVYIRETLESRMSQENNHAGAKPDSSPSDSTTNLSTDSTAGQGAHEAAAVVETWVGGSPFGAWLERWVKAAEAVIESLGYELADIERAGHGLLRVTLDGPEGISVEDCERVSHQLSRLLEVENVSYDRLEISSPGVDRALKRSRDFDTYLGEEVAVKLRRALENRKQFVGVLGKGEGDSYTLLIPAEKKNEADRQLVFTLAELDSARLVPHLNFRRASK